jgi:hypothetical protein
MQAHLKEDYSDAHESNQGGNKMNVRFNLLALVLAGLAAQPSFAADPTGTWRWEHEDLAGSGETIQDVLTIEVNDGEVSGIYSTPDGDVPIENAAMDGDALHWELNIDAQGQMFSIVFDGDIAGDDIVGTVALGDFGEFPWAAKRDSMQAVDPSGTWRWEHPDLEGSGEIVPDILNITYKDGKVTGTYTSPEGDVPIENASLEGNTMHWELNLDSQGQMLNLAWTGDITGDDVSGTIKFGDFGEFPWAAKRDAVVAVDPSGTWRWEHDDAAGGGMIKDVLTIAFNDGKVSGTYSSPPIDGPIENASMKGDMLHWEIELDAGGTFIEIVFDGKIEGDDVTGTVSLGDFGEFPWTAKRD